MAAVIVAAHQPGYLPGVSVIAKIAQADAVVWLDDVRLTMPGFVNRNQLPDGTWLAVPVDRQDHRTPIREVTIAADPGRWRVEHYHALQRYADEPHFDKEVGRLLGADIAAGGAPLVDLNLALVDRILEDLGLPAVQYRQSELGVATTGSLSARIARLVTAIGGTAYLAPARSRLDRAVFAAAGVELLAFDFAGPNWSIVDSLFRTGDLPSTPRQEVSAA
jgi:WbqC-like protein family